MSKELPKTGDIIFQLTIDKGIISKSKTLIVKDIALSRCEVLGSYFSDGNICYNSKYLFPCKNICGGPLNAPLGLEYSAFLYCHEKDIEEAIKYLVNEYAQDCLTAANEAEVIVIKLRKYFDIAKGNSK